MVDEYLQIIINIEREKIYLSHNLLNINALPKYNEELVGLNQYLPNILQGYMANDYYFSLIKNGVWDKVLEQMKNSKYYSYEESSLEFVEWIKKHPQFQELLNTDELDRINQELKDLDDIINNN